MGNIEEPSYNTSAIFESAAGKAVSKVSYTPVSEVEYDGLRKSATIKCLDEKAKRNPCDPASKLNSIFNLSKLRIFILISQSS